VKLLELGADIDQRDFDGKTALSLRPPRGPTLAILKSNKWYVPRWSGSARKRTNIDRQLLSR
jgi:hypothetical protein